MAAILDEGFDDSPLPNGHGLPRSNSRPIDYYSSRYQLADTPTKGRISPLPDTDADSPPRTGDSMSTSIETRGYGHAKKRSGGAAAQERYGHLGPLADDDMGWGRGP